MDPYRLRRWLTAALAVASSATTVVGHAEGRVVVSPSVVLAAIYDDNLFYTAEPTQDDWLVRLTPGVAFGYHSSQWKFDAKYSFDAERYLDRTELDDYRVREGFDLALDYEPSRSLNISADADYIQTQTPADITPQSGRQLRRSRAERLSLGPSISYQFNRLTQSTLEYQFTRDRLSGGVDTDTHRVLWDIDRRLSRRAIAKARYRGERFRFDTGQESKIHALLVGGTYQFTRRSSLTGLVGKRVPDDAVEGSLSLFHSLDRGELSFSYLRSASTVLGVAGLVDTETYSASLWYALGADAELRISPSYFSSERAPLHTEVALFNIEFGYRFARYLSLLSSYQYSDQRGSLQTRSAGDVRRHLLLVGLALSVPQRAEDASRPRILRPSPRSSEATAGRDHVPQGDEE